MLPAQLLEGLPGGPGASCLYIRVSLTDTFDRFLIIPMFPCERFGQNLIQGGGGLLPVAPGVAVQLGLLLRSEGDHLHTPKLKISWASVNPGSEASSPPCKRGG